MRPGVEAQLEQFEDRSDGEYLRLPTARGAIRRTLRASVQGHLYRMTGVDLTRIDGVEAYTALKVISEVGTDMTKWPSAKHFASWLGLSPHNRITGGKVISSKTKASANRAAAALRLAANALHRSDSALVGAFLRRKKAHLGAPKAITASWPTNWPGSSSPCWRYGHRYVDAEAAEYYEHQYPAQRALHTARRAGGTTGLPVGAHYRCPDLGRPTDQTGHGVTPLVSP